MKRIGLKAIVAALMMLTANSAMLFAQKVGFVSSEEIRKHFIEALQADQRVQSMVDSWKRQLKQMEQDIEDLEYEIQKKRLVWSDAEKAEKEKELESLKQQRLVFAKQKFEEGGEYDKAVTQMYKPVESKIFAAVQEVSADEGYDMILDKSLHPIPYANPKYDITVKVLKKLGVDVKELEKQLKEQVDKDPRNQKTQSKEAPKRRSRERKNTDQTIDREDENKDKTTDENKVEKPRVLPEVQPDYEPPKKEEEETPAK